MSSSSMPNGAASSSSSMPNGAASSSSSKATSTSPTHTLDSFRPLVKKLILSIPIPGLPTTTANSSSSSSSLDNAYLQSLFDHLSNAEFTSNHAHHAQLGSVLSGLRLGGLDVRPETLLVASQTFLAKSIAVDSRDGQCKLTTREEVQRRLREEPEWSSSPSSDPSSVSSSFSASNDDLITRLTTYTGTLDLVGTGGDGQDTFNVSTTAAMVASGVPGVRVCKHGAKASSSTSGSADLLLSLGIPLLSLTPSTLANLVAGSCSFVFLFAQLFHPSLAPLAPIRRALGHPTIFNVLGPLVNPARPRRCVLGVHSAYLGPIFAEALRKRGCERAWVVCGREGLDEISIEGETDVWELSNGDIRHFVVNPSDFGLQSYPLTQVASYTSDENAAIVLRLLGAPSHPSSQDPPSLASSVPSAANLEAIEAYTILQASALLYVGGHAHSYAEASRLARISMRSGAALRSLREFRERAREAVQKREEEEAQKGGLASEAERMKRQREEEDARASVQQGGGAGAEVRSSEGKATGGGDEYFYAPAPTRSVGVATEEQ